MQIQKQNLQVCLTVANNNVHLISVNTIIQLKSNTVYRTWHVYTHMYANTRLMKIIKWNKNENYW